MITRTLAERGGGEGTGRSVRLGASQVVPQVRSLLARPFLPTSSISFPGVSKRSGALLPPTLMRHPVYVTEQLATIGIDGGRIVISKYREELASVRLIDVPARIDMGKCASRARSGRSLTPKYSVFHFTYGGWLSGIDGPVKNVK